MPDLSTPITIRSDNDSDTVTVTITPAQLAALADTIASNVDLETIALDNGEPERAAFLDEFCNLARTGPRLLDCGYVHPWEA
jgi:hypothetical protein